MENATKALLIAGAVLLVIMIISVGLMIFNSANGQITGAISQMNQQEKDQFNQKFLGYEGKNVSGSSVKTLISTVIAHNNQMTQEGTEEKNVKVTTGSTEQTDLNAARQAVVSGGKYTVTVTINSSTGLVDTIDYKNNATTTSNNP